MIDQFHFTVPFETESNQVHKSLEMYCFIKTILMLEYGNGKQKEAYVMVDRWQDTKEAYYLIQQLRDYGYCDFNDTTIILTNDVLLRRETNPYLYCSANGLKIYNDLEKVKDEMEDVMMGDVIKECCVNV
jgi:hypothetical protein